MNNRYDKRELAGERYLDARVIKDQPEYVKEIIRHWKHDLLDGILDQAHHERYWVIRFREEWIDAQEEWPRAGYPSDPQPGDKIVRLYGSITEAHTEHWTVPVGNPVAIWEIPNKKHAATIYQKAKSKFWEWAHRGLS